MTAHLDGIVAAATQAASLCQRLLEYAGESPVTFEPVDLNALVRETRDLVASSMPPDARLELELDDQLDAITAVPDQVRQILMNLFINASDALDAAGGTIRVRTRFKRVRDKLTAQWQQSDDLRAGDFVSLEVEDGGCGMTDETVERMFDPFYTTKVDGRGLGLSAVLGIVRLHGGALKVESAPGQGARFEILLPVAGQSPALSKQRSQPEQASLRHGTVLVVDDESAVREVARQMLELAGYQVQLARDGDEAIAVCSDRGKAVRLVLLDLKLAHTSGVQTARLIHKVAPGLPILFMSGHTEESLELESFSTTRVGFLPKPFTFDQLLDKLDELAS